MDSLAIPHVAHMLSINLQDIHAHDFVTSMVVSIRLRVLYLLEISLYFFLVNLFRQYSNLMAVKFLPVCSHLFLNQALIIIFVQLKVSVRHHTKSPLYDLPIPFYKKLPSHCNFHEDFGRKCLLNGQQQMLAARQVSSFSSQ